MTLFVGLKPHANPKSKGRVYFPKRKDSAYFAPSNGSTPWMARALRNDVAQAL
jgi:hypothetical protein